MKLENQVSSLELSKKLKELGVKQEDRLFYWSFYDDGNSQDKPGIAFHDDCNFGFMEDLIAAFTVAELGEMLPMSLENSRGTIKYHLYHSKWNNGWVSQYENEAGTQFKNTFKNEDTEADVRAKMLVYLLENKLI